MTEAKANRRSFSQAMMIVSSVGHFSYYASSTVIRLKSPITQNSKDIPTAERAQYCLQLELAD